MWFRLLEDTILYAAAFDANGGVFEPLLTKEDAIVMKMEMAAESRATQFHMRLSVDAEEAEARAFMETLPTAQNTPTQNHRFNAFMQASSSLYGHDPRHGSSICVHRIQEVRPCGPIRDVGDHSILQLSLKSFL